MPFLVARFAFMSQAVLPTAWRSECSVEGLDIEVTVHGVLIGSDLGNGSSLKCRAAFLSDADFSQPGLEVSGIDVLFTDSLAVVPFGHRRGKVHFLDNVSEFRVPDDLDAIVQRKSYILSVLLPPPESHGELAHAIHQQAMEILPDHIYVDDGRPETHAAAFERYRFSLIVDDKGNRSISQALVNSIAYHTIALFNGFVEIGSMVFNGVADFEWVHGFDLLSTLTTVNRHNDHLGALWHYQRTIQDMIKYRYNRPFEERLMSQACTICRLLAGPSPAPLAFVGIYSARANAAKREAIRKTWGRVLHEVYGLRYRFFLGEAPSGASRSELALRREMEEYDDLVFLDALEGYRMNSQKGLLFLEWVARRVEAEFLLKVDDDVYLRPSPLLDQLRNRPPANYAWGYFDYISPVPREDGHAFFNAPETFPFDVFPPYPRGVVRVLSMDVVRRLSEASRVGKLRTIFGDDPCMGVHLRQILMDPDEPFPSLALDDFDNRVFAMEPSCHDNLWSKATGRTWAIHHVTPEQVHCMWSADVSGGYYEEVEGTLQRNAMFEDAAHGYGLPDLCECMPDTMFTNRTDLDDLKTLTDDILFGDG